MELEEFITPYYCLNFLLAMVYPILRFGVGIKSYKLMEADNWLGHTREITISLTFLLLGVARYKKYCTAQHMVSSVLFYAKVGTAALLFFIGFNLVVIYIFVCLIVYLMFRFPVQRGKHRFIKINTEDEFDRLVLGFGQTGNKKHLGKQKAYEQMDMAFVEFYAPFAETCRYTRQIWAEYSLKYATDKLKFFEVNVDALPELAKKYRINTGTYSRQLPTVILFEDGIEESRFPMISKEGKIGKAVRFDKRELAKYFNLQERCLETGGNPIAQSKFK